MGAHLEEAKIHLAASGEVMARLIKQFEPPRIDPKPPSAYFDTLVSTIISQQLSVKAADTIEARLRGGVNDFSPANVAALPVSEFRLHGISGSKANYIKGIAEAFVDGRLDPLELEAMDDKQITAALTALKGVGPWSAEMFLMFGMGHPDVWSPGDLGLRNAVRSLFGDDIDVVATTETWRPYRTYAALYLWKYTDGTPAPRSQ